MAVDLHITYISTWAGFLYLAIVLDARSRKIEMIDLASQRLAVVVVWNADAISERTP